jgi:hypothetical protein
MGSEPQALKDADLSGMAKRLPGSGRSSLALQVPVLAPLLPVPALPLLAWRRRLAFSARPSWALLFSVPLCLVPLFSALLFSALASWRRPS